MSAVIARRRKQLLDFTHLSANARTPSRESRCSSKLRTSERGHTTAARSSIPSLARRRAFAPAVPARKARGAYGLFRIAQVKPPITVPFTTWATVMRSASAIPGGSTRRSVG